MFLHAYNKGHAQGCVRHLYTLLNNIKDRLTHVHATPSGKTIFMLFKFIRSQITN